MPELDYELYARQLILPEVGVAGQSKLAASPFAPAPTYPHEVQELARLYAERAGCPPSGDCPPGPELSADFQAQFRHSAARNIALGAALALAHIRWTLGLSPPAPEARS